MQAKGFGKGGAPAWTPTGGGFGRSAGKGAAPPQAQNGQAWQQAPPQGIKRLGEVPAMAGVIKAARPQGAAAIAMASGKQVYTVYAKGPTEDDTVMKTLQGDYVEHSTNHNRKAFQKAAEAGSKDFVAAFLYYWDGRDGPSFEGWWFGNEIGGSQVWSHCMKGDQNPPINGWKIPWDGPVSMSFVVENKAAKEQKDAEAAMGSVGSDSEAGLASAQSALQEAKSLAGDLTSLEAIQSAEELLTPQMSSLAELQRGLAGASSARQGGPEALKKLTQLAAQLRSAQAALNSELMRLKNGKKTAQQYEQEKVFSEKDIIAWEEMLPEITDKSNTAEDAVEKAAITAEMISAAGDDLQSCRMAVDETEKAAKEAQLAIGEARVFLNAKMASIRRFQAASVRDKASGELTKLQATLQEAQQKLNPFKNARQDFIQKQAAEKLVTEVLDKLTLAELDVDRAEEASAILAGGIPTNELLTAAQKAVAKASDHIQNCQRFMDSKKKSATGLVMQELQRLEERATEGIKRLGELKNAQKEHTERIAVGALIEDADTKLGSAKAALTKACEAETPFLMGVEDLASSDMQNKVKELEAATTAATTACSQCKMFIATKVVEVKRYTATASEEATMKLKTLQEQLEEMLSKLGELKKGNASRRRDVLSRESEAQVANAESLAAKVAEAAQSLSDDSKLMDLSTQEMREAADAVNKADMAAGAAFATVRKFLTAKQIEIKQSRDSSNDFGPELIKFQTRLSTAQADVSKHKKVAQSVEQRIAARKIVDEAAAKVTNAEEKAEKAVGSAAELSDTAETDVVKAVDKEILEAQLALKQSGRELEMRARQQSEATKAQLQKLDERQKQAQAKLEKTQATMKARAEKSAVRAILDETKEKTDECEAAEKRAADAELPFLKGDEDMANDETARYMAELEKAANEAHTLLAACKTFIAMKRLAAKRLSEQSSTSTQEELGKYQERHDEMSKRVAVIKKDMMDRKLRTVRQEAAGKIEEVQVKVKTAAEALKILQDAAKSEKEGAGTEDSVRDACGQAVDTQKEAQKALAEARTLLLTRTREVRAAPNVDPTLIADLNKLTEQLRPISTDVEKQKGGLREHEGKFLAEKVINDATAMLEKLEQKGEDLVEMAGPMFSDKKADFTCGVHQDLLLDAMRKYMAKATKTPKELFQEMSSSSDKADQSAFLAYMKKMPELSEDTGIDLSEDQLRAVFEKVSLSELVDEADWIALFKTTYYCTAVIAMTDVFDVKAGKTTRKLQLEEIVEALEEPQKDELGLARVKVKAAKDGMEGFVTVAGNAANSTKYLEVYSTFVVLQKKAEESFKDVQACISETNKYLDAKAEELKANNSGPMANAKRDLAKMKPRVSKVQISFSQLKKKVADAGQQHSASVALAKKQQQEAVNRKAASLLIKDVEDPAAAIEALLAKIMPAAEELVKTRGADNDDPAKSVAELEGDLKKLFADTTASQEKLKAKLENFKSAKEGPSIEARNMLVKLKVRLTAIDVKGKKSQRTLVAVREALSQDAILAVAQSLRSGDGHTVDGMFQKLSKDGQQIAADAFREYLAKLAAPAKKTQLDMAMLSFTEGVTRFRLASMLQEYQKCVKEIAITNSFSVKDSKTLRKLELGEIVQVLGAPQHDETLKADRVSVRAIVDQKEGWVTLQGNKGTPFLEKCEKLYKSVTEEIELQTGFESGSAEVRKLDVGEILEVLEGPRKEPPIERQRLKGKGSKEATKGWVTLKDASGSNFELAKLLVCKQSIALTTAFDIEDSESKSIRKLDVGETLELLEEAQQDEKQKLLRIRVKAKKDDKEGWVTKQGNKGTKYVDETTTHYICQKADLPMELTFASGSKEQRKLDEGEVFEASEPVKTEVQQGSQRMRCRTSDGKEGWMTMVKKAVCPWSMRYKCKSVSVFTDLLDLEPAKTLRRLEVDEEVEALDIPYREEKTNVWRIRVKAAKDSQIGFVTIKGNAGTQILEPMATGGTALQVAAKGSAAPPVKAS